ncbi:MAG: glutamine synthetase family protein [Lachnospiraceae bacterium]|nr:glutamine synthetase family protein [Lachnospiraceae bacterium]
MKYSKDEILQFAEEEDVKFIRLAFCDVFGRQKNISIMPDELPRAFEQGIAFDASSILGFGDETHSDLLLHPESDTLTPLPWRPEHGRVVQMFSSITYPDGTPFECDTRRLLKNAIEDAKKAGFNFTFGAEQEFYLFLVDEKGKKTKIPSDEAGYMDIAPDDKGENVRREVCLTLEKMGIHPESSHHEEGPGQNEIDFRYADPLMVADNAQMFQRVVKTVANRNGLVADFSPKPLRKAPGNGFHVNMSVYPFDENGNFKYMLAGILKNIKAMTLFLNPTRESYLRLGNNKAPGFISWSAENRSQLIRIPAAVGEYRRAELRSPDPGANPYLAFTLLIRAGLEGIQNKLTLPESADVNLFTAAPNVLSKYEKLPRNYREACRSAVSSDFIKKHIPSEILEIYLKAR